MDATTCDWSPRMLSLLGLDAAKLPPIRRPAEILGAVTAQAAAETHLLQGTPVVIERRRLPDGAARLRASAGPGSAPT